MTVRDAVPAPSDREEETVEPPPAPTQETELEAGDLAAAVAAALAIMDDDRFRRRAENYLLKADAEVGLAVLVRGGADRIAQEPDREALKCLPPGDIRVRARDCMVLHNQRLVHKLVPRYLEQGLDYEDLFQNGVLGLMTAARKFNPAKGFKFSTYATWWIRQSISRAIADEGALIRIPVHMHEQVRKVAGAERTLAGQGRSTRAADVAVYCDMSVGKIEEVRRLSRRTDSLDRVIGDGSTLGDLVGRTHALPSVEQGVLHAIQLEQVMAVVDSFSGRDARILVRRLGLDGDDPSTLDELGQEFGVTRERIRQVEVKARVALKDRLQEAGIVHRHDDGHGRELDEEKTGPAARRSVGNAAIAAVAQEPQPQQDVEREPRKNLLPVPVPVPVPVPEQQLTPRAAEPAAVAEEIHEPQADRGIGDLPERSPSSAVATSGVSVASVTPEQSPPAAMPPAVAEPAQHSADWQEALRMPTAFAGGVAWLAEYALLAVGHLQLTVLLGRSAADAVMRAAREQGILDRPVVTALEVLRRVFDTVKAAGLMPEDFFERPAEALVGLTPRMYLSKKPLVLSESRLAVRDALLEFVAEVPLREDAAGPPDAKEDAHGLSGNPSVDQLVQPEEAPNYAGLPDGPTTPAEADPACIEDLVAGLERDFARAETERQLAQLRAEAEQSLTAAREEYEAQMARLRHEHRLHLAEEQDRADARLDAAHADTERQLGAQEEALLRRVDESLLRTPPGTASAQSGRRQNRTPRRGSP
ncbi:sigma-70 family RNA polymerase sigma factor [Streptomyces sp. NBC_00370]